MITYYEPVSVRGFKSGACSVCGKTAERSRTFTNTINPFNRNEDGSVRTRQEIYTRLNEMLRDWQSEPIRHARCES